MSETVPEFWRVDADALPAAVPARPIRKRWLPFAVVGSLFAPARWGPRVANSRMTTALLVSGFALVLSIVASAVGADWYRTENLIDEVSSREFSLSEKLRLPAVFVIELFYRSYDPAESLAPIAIGAATFVLAWLGAWLLMPFLFVGNGNRHAYWRGVKIALWGTLAVPIAVLVFVLLRWIDAKSVERIIRFGDDEMQIGCVVIALALWIGLCLRMAMGCARNAGSPAQLTPLCGGCGYVVTGLPTDGRCPECGHAVAGSLPEARKAPRWATCGGLLARLWAFPGTLWASARAPNFYATLRVLTGGDAAIRFALWTSWLFAGVTVMTWVTIGLLFGEGDVRETLDHNEFWVTIGVVGWGLATIYRLAIAGLALRACALGGRDPRRGVVATAYAGAALIPVPLVLVVSFGLAALFFDVAGDHSYSASMVRKATVATAAFLIAAAPPLTVLTLGLFRYQKALKDVRHAAA